MLEVEIQRLDHYPKDTPLPQSMTEHSVGIDLRAAMEKSLTLKSLERVLVPTGIVLAIPPGHEAQLRPRSGLALKRGLTLLNTPGTIDPDYRGEIKVLMVNLSDRDAVIEPGERIAQIVFASVIKVIFREAKNLSSTDRGPGGFGHTGTK